MHFCPCCGTPWPTDAEMEACHQHCLDERQADARAAQNQPNNDPKKK